MVFCITYSQGQTQAVDYSYNSKFKVGDLTSSDTLQLALIYRLLAEREDEDGHEIDPPILMVELQQKGITDCGLFAIAFAVQPFPLTQTAPHHQNYFPFIEIKLFCRSNA